MDYISKYLKYKVKYLNLVQMTGGMLALQSREMVEERQKQIDF